MSHQALNTPGSFRNSAGGKVILIGEHAVLYGVPALAAPLTEGVVGEAVFCSGPTRWEVDGSCVVSTGSGPFSTGIRLAEGVLASAGITASLRIQSILPAGMGLGWSAAVAYAVAGLTYQLIRQDDPRSRIALANDMEQAFHGRASGLDLAAVSSGTLVHMRLVNGERNIKLYHLIPPGVGIIAGTQPSSTHEMVALVRHLVEREPAACQKVFETLTALSESLLTQLKEGDGVAVGHSLSQAHRALQKLEVSTPGLDALVEAAEQNGAWGAKLTGAGGGGCVLALAPPDKADAILAAMRPQATFVRKVEFASKNPKET